MVDLVGRATGIDDCGRRYVARGCYQGVAEVDPLLDTCSDRAASVAAGKACAQNVRRTGQAQEVHRVEVAQNVAVREDLFRTNGRSSAQCGHRSASPTAGIKAGKTLRRPQTPHVNGTPRLSRQDDLGRTLRGPAGSAATPPGGSTAPWAFSVLWIFATLAGFSTRSGRFAPQHPRSRCPVSQVIRWRTA
jgi:hypothetical protein